MFLRFLSAPADANPGTGAPDKADDKAAMKQAELDLKVKQAEEARAEAEAKAAKLEKAQAKREAEEKKKADESRMANEGAAGLLAEKTKALEAATERLARLEAAETARLEAEIKKLPDASQKVLAALKGKLPLEDFAATVAMMSSSSPSTSPVGAGQGAAQQSAPPPTGAIAGAGRDPREFQPDEMAKQMVIAAGKDPKQVFAHMKPSVRESFGAADESIGEIASGTSVTKHKLDLAAWREHFTPGKFDRLTVEKADARRRAI